MLGPPFGLFVLGLVGALIGHKVRESSSPSMLAVAAISLMILKLQS
jgi:hypothetical protein